MGGGQDWRQARRRLAAEEMDPFGNVEFDRQLSQAIFLFAFPNQQQPRVGQIA